MKLNQISDSIWTIEHFVSKKECDDLILFSEMRGFEEAKVNLANGPKMIKGIRNNLRLIYDDNNLAEKYWKRLAKYCPSILDQTWKASGLNEKFRFYKYESNQRFKKHIDGRFKRSENEESRITFMIYLNHDFKGGETAFEENIINPSSGMALCFIHELKHEGLPVITGSKYVLRSDVMYKQIKSIEPK